MPSVRIPTHGKMKYSAPRGEIMRCYDFRLSTAGLAGRTNLNNLWLCCGKNPETRFGGAWLMTTGSEVIAFLPHSTYTEFNQRERKTYLRLWFFSNKDRLEPVVDNTLFRHLIVRVLLTERVPELFLTVGPDEGAPIEKLLDLEDCEPLNAGNGRQWDLYIPTFLEEQKQDQRRRRAGGGGGSGLPHARNNSQEQRVREGPVSNSKEFFIHPSRLQKISSASSNNLPMPPNVRSSDLLSPRRPPPRRGIPADFGAPLEPVLQPTSCIQPPQGPPPIFQPWGNQPDLSPSDFSRSDEEALNPKKKKAKVHPAFIKYKKMKEALSDARAEGLIGEEEHYDPNKPAHEVPLLKKSSESVPEDPFALPGSSGAEQHSNEVEVEEKSTLAATEKKSAKAKQPISKKVVSSFFDQIKL